MLVDELLGQLDFNIKLCHTFIVLDIEVLIIEKWIIFRIVSDLQKADHFWIRPSHILLEHNRVFLGL